jgi:[acyl-carrier-protein] S-malonyltransferase
MQTSLLQFSRSKTLDLLTRSSISDRLSPFNRQPMASASMAVLPSAPVRQISSHGQRARISALNKFPSRSRVSMSAAVGSQMAVVDDLLFKDYKPTCAFLFPGQVIV